MKTIMPSFIKPLVLCAALLALALASSAHAQDGPVKPTFKVSLKEAHKGTLKIDTKLLDSYGRLPEARRQFYFAGRKILASEPGADFTDPRISNAAQKFGFDFISEPMLGQVSHDGITVGFRSALDEALTVQVSTSGSQDMLKFPAPKTGPGIPGGAGIPGSPVRVRLSGLKANTQYTYEVVTAGGRKIGGGRFMTVPAPDHKEKFRIAIGSCFHKIGVHNPNLMRLVAKRGARAMVLVGDSAVDDREAMINMHRADYLLRDVSRPWRTLARDIPTYASWDDHDYLNNDKSGLQKGQITVQQRADMRRLWRNNWCNPGYATKEDKGIYFTTVIGDVQLIMLDTRSCRTWSKRGAKGSYLGEAQTKWLLETLKTAKASGVKFILLTSGTMWSDYVSSGKDSWGTWDKQGRKEIFDFIEENKIGGVLLFSGDRHGARGVKIRRPSGFEIYEFEPASLGGIPGPKAYIRNREMQLFGYSDNIIALGELTFDMSQSDPTVTFRLINEKEKVLAEHMLKRSELTPK